jgi:hypothetical protein
MPRASSFSTSTKSPSTLADVPCIVTQYEARRTRKPRILYQVDTRLTDKTEMSKARRELLIAMSLWYKMAQFRAGAEANVDVALADVAMRIKRLEQHPPRREAAKMSCKTPIPRPS